MLRNALERILPCLLDLLLLRGGRVFDCLGAAVPRGAVGERGVELGAGASGAPGGLSRALPAPVPGTGGARILSPGTPNPVGFSPPSLVS